MEFFIFIQILKETSVSKKWRTFALVADVPQKDAMLIWVNQLENMHGSAAGFISRATSLGRKVVLLKGCGT